ncbi:MAG: ABC transporter permease [Thermovirgaceae bacterium]|nr:ABC transporter permease [Synergistales bacterium]MDI9393737.1 ABC transporter permease [Synergistota bacterium]HRW87651.1 ABC transporter permease [Thermovirgaceae bacterium]MDD3830089.1 ABC transporter permease [Synergistales bacterium]MDD5514311.1 ABC transporter permease [Synergistales bacterium]
MWSYWSRRALGAVAVLLLVIAANFFLFRVMPGDAVSTIVDPRFSPEAKERLRELFGLDLPLYRQFLIYVRRMLTFDLGISFLSQRPVWEELKSRIPNTVALLGSALFLSSALGIWLGVKAARRRGGLTEKLVLVSGSVSFSFPSFFVQLVLLLFFAYTFPVFPLRGSVSIPLPEGAFARALDYLWHLLLPVGSLVLLGFGSWAIYVRNLMVKTLGEDFILLARARGLPEGRILWNHAFRSALPPVLTIFLLALPGIVSGAVITETVFSLHGVGKYLLDSIMGHDYPAAGAAFYILGLLTIVSNLAADAAYALADPRIRVGRRAQR